MKKNVEDAQEVSAVKETRKKKKMKKQKKMKKKMKKKAEKMQKKKQQSKKHEKKEEKGGGGERKEKRKQEENTTKTVRAIRDADKSTTLDRVRTPPHTHTQQENEGNKERARSKQAYNRTYDTDRAAHQNDIEGVCPGAASVWRLYRTASMGTLSGLSGHPPPWRGRPITWTHTKKRKFGWIPCDWEWMNEWLMGWFARLERWLMESL